jgi:hypothetical protein
LVYDLLNKSADNRFVLFWCHKMLSFSANFGNSVKRVIGKPDSNILTVYKAKNARRCPHMCCWRGG